MKSYGELKVLVEAIQGQMVEANKSELANALEEVKRFCKEVDFTAWMHISAFAEVRNKV